MNQHNNNSKLDSTTWKEQFTEGLLESMNQGSVAIPHLFIKYYPQMQLSDMEAMFLIHLLTFKEKENNDFPTIEEIQMRMASEPDVVINTIQKLMKEGFLTIDQEVDPVTDIQYEKYNLKPAFEKLAYCYAEEQEKRRTDIAVSEANKTVKSKQEIRKENNESKDIFTVFEKEFARPLSPMECETISGWIDQDGYIQELILAALKEAVFAGKLHFRYIDRILLEWSRNRVFTVEQAKEHTQKFRSSK